MRTILHRFTAIWCAFALTFASSVSAQNAGLIMIEDFEAGSLPTGWSLSQQPGSDGWLFGQGSVSGGAWDVPAPPAGGLFAISNDDACNCDMSADALTSPMYDLTPFDSVVFLFDLFFNAEYGSIAQLEVSYDAGASWVFVPLPANPAWQVNLGWTLVDNMDLLGNQTPWPFTDQMMFRFVHNDDGGWADGVAVDNLALVGYFNPCDMSAEDGQWPGSAITPDPSGAVTTISTNQYIGSEYSVITGISVGRTYEFTHAYGSYITVREGAVAGTVVAEGFSPVTYAATSAADLYVHWTADGFCAVDATGSYLTTVQDVTSACDMSGEDGQWPGSSITPDAGGAVTTIATNQFIGSEYSVLTGIVTGNLYELTHAYGSYITVREGAIAGVVVAEGYSPLQFTATSSSDLYVHWTVDELCAVDGSGSYLTTVQNFGTPPCDMSGEDGQFPGSAITPDPSGAVTTISTNQYIGSEYSVITGISGGRTYEFTHAYGSYITVREGAVAGTVVAAGFSPVTYTATSAADLYVHWTADEFCAVDGTGSYLTTVQDITAPCDMSGEDGLWPSSPVTPDAGGAVTTISSNQYIGSEYSVLTGINSGDYYELTHAYGSYITVREGAVAGPVVAQGYSPLQFTATSSSDLYVHWTADDLCSVDGSGAYLTTVQNFGVPPCDMSVSNGGSGQWPTSSITADAGGAVTTISTNQYVGSEYSVITGVLEGHKYVFTHASGSFITVRIGTVDGAVLASGYSPLSVIANGTDDLYVHWTADDACTVDNTGSVLTTVQDLGLAPCDMTSASGQYPSGSITPDAGGLVTTISTVQYGGSEYSVITGVMSGSYYEFTHANGAYITVREGSVDGPVVDAGYSPLTVMASSSSDLYVHWTVDEFCNTDATGAYETTVQLLLDPCLADAGTLSPDASPVELVGGSATISATVGNAPVVPGGYIVTYGLVDANGVIQQVSASASFTVNAVGVYTIHALVHDPVTLNPGMVQLGVTTAAEVNALLIQGGGSICGALDLTGASITVEIVTSIAEALDRNLSVFPNPSNGQFTVQLNGVEGEATMNIVDVMGRNVFTQAVTLNGTFRQALNLNVAKGSYLLQVITDNGVATRKVELQ